jgi:hypothetical protein
MRLKIRSAPSCITVGEVHAVAPSDSTTQLFPGENPCARDIPGARQSETGEIFIQCPFPAESYLLSLNRLKEARTQPTCNEECDRECQTTLVTPSLPDRLRSHSPDPTPDFARKDCPSLAFTNSHPKAACNSLLRQFTRFNSDCSQSPYRISQTEDRIIEACTVISLKIYNG